MKHIQKRFLIESKNQESILKIPGSELVEVVDENFKKKLSESKGRVVFIKTDKDSFIGGFVHKIDGKDLLLPVPDPTLIYFNNAQMNIKKIKEIRKVIIKHSNPSEYSEVDIIKIYEYFGLTSGFVIFLFTSIESFINQMIPNNIVFKKSTSKNTELYNKTQIQEYLDFKTKIKEVIPQLTGKNYFGKSTPSTQHIWNLKEFRDSIIHTKQEENPMMYNDLIKTALNFKYESTLEAVAKFMNYYKTGYIIECDCGADF